MSAQASTTALAEASANANANASKPANASASNPANPSNAAAKAANASTQAAANAATAVVSNANPENVEVSVGNKNYTCVIRKIDENKNAKNGEIVVTKNGQKYAVTVTEPSKVNGGRIKRVTRNQKKKKTRSTRK